MAIGDDLDLLAACQAARMAPQFTQFCGLLGTAFVRDAADRPRSRTIVLLANRGLDLHAPDYSGFAVCRTPFVLLKATAARCASDVDFVARGNDRLLCRSDLGDKRGGAVRRSPGCNYHLQKGAHFDRNHQEVASRFVLWFLGVSPIVDGSNCRAREFGAGEWSAKRGGTIVARGRNQQEPAWECCVCSRFSPSQTGRGP